MDEFDTEGYHEASQPPSEHRCDNLIVETIAQNNEFVLMCHGCRLYWQTGLFDQSWKTTVAVRKMKAAAEARYGAVKAA